MAYAQVMVETLFDGLIELRPFNHRADVVVHPCLLELLLLLVCHLFTRLLIRVAHVDLPGDALPFVRTFNDVLLLEVLSDIGCVEDGLLLLSDEAASSCLLVSSMGLWVGLGMLVAVVDAKSMSRGQVLINHRG